MHELAGAAAEISQKPPEARSRMIHKTPFCFQPFGGFFTPSSPTLSLSHFFFTNWNTAVGGKPPPANIIEKVQGFGAHDFQTALLQVGLQKHRR